LYYVFVLKDTILDGIVISFHYQKNCYCSGQVSTNCLW